MGDGFYRLKDPTIKILKIYEQQQTDTHTDKRQKTIGEFLSDKSLPVPSAEDKTAL